MTPADWGPYTHYILLSYGLSLGVLILIVIVSCYQRRHAQCRFETLKNAKSIPYDIP